MRRSLCRGGRGHLFSVPAGDLPGVFVFRLDIPYSEARPMPRLSPIDVAGRVLSGATR